MIDFRCFGLWMLLILALTGCSTMGQGLFPKKDIPVVPNGQELFQAAMRTFEAANYEQARKDFQAVADSDHAQEIVRKAQYGVACSALAQAENEEELKEAQQLFEKWAVKAPSYLPSEDPRLLHPVIKDYYLQSTNTVLELKEECKDFQERHMALIREKKALQTANEDLQEENAKLQAKLDALESLQDELRKMRQDTEK